MSQEYTSTEGCESSFADAKHDFHTIFKADKIQEYVKENIPFKDTVCAIDDEDTFIDHFLLGTGSKSSGNKDNKRYIVENLNEDLKSRYTADYIPRSQHDFTNTTSQLQEYFQSKGLTTDIFFICDVAYSNVREDLKYASQSNQQTFYWVQNAQTLYDPAGKTTWHSDKPYFEKEDDAGVEYVGSTEKIPSPNHFKKNDSRFLFCWQNAKENIVTYYPKWDYRSFDISYKFSENLPEKMLYTNKNLYLGIRAGDVNDYSTHESYLIITNPEKKGYFGFADKNLAAKGSGILKPAELASYRAKGDDLKRFVKFINNHLKYINNSATEKIPAPLFLDEVMNYSSVFQILAKKVGDASQSLSCCQQKLNLQKFANNETGEKKETNIINFESNGNHAFVSFDRIAIGCALNYNCPIVIGNTQEGFNVFIRNDLLNIHNQFTIYFSKNSNGSYQMLNTLKQNQEGEMKEVSNFILNSKLYDEIKKNGNEVRENLKTACLLLNVIPIDNTTYQQFLINYFVELNVLQLFSNLDLSILNFNETELNDDIKNMYVSKIENIKEKDPTLVSEEFLNFESINSINDIIQKINNNLSEIIEKLNTKYNSVKADVDTTNYDTKENTEKNIQLKEILDVVKIVEHIIIEIGKKQKQLITNYESMKKINDYQEEINAGDKQYVNKLPKGVATNIIDCVPFTYYITNSRAPRNSDVFFERSTSIFGTTTVILQIFNILNCSALNKLKERFVKIIYKTLNDLEDIGSKVNNVSFTTIINASRSQLNDMSMPIPSDFNITVIDSNFNLQDFFPSIEPVSVTDQLSAGPQIEGPQLEGPQIEGPQLEGPQSAGPQSAGQSPGAIIGPLENLSEEQSDIELTTDSIRQILKDKKLFVIKKSTNTGQDFKSRVNEIIEASKEIKDILNEVKEGNVTNIANPLIETAYENEIFIKGFIGLFLFMKYITFSTGKKTPILFRSTGNVSQDTIFQRLFNFMYLNLEDDTVDPNFDKQIQSTKKDIENKIPGFNLDEYTGAVNKDFYIKSKIMPPVVPSEETIKSLKEYVDFYIKLTNDRSTYEKIYNIDASIDEFKDKSDFMINSFQKLLEMNVVTFGNKPLTDKFSGINGDEINVNIALLYFIENRIASLNKDPIPHPELIGLFSQLFKQTGIYPREYIKGGGEEDDGLFDTMYSLFISNISSDKDIYRKYKKNSYLLLNMPTSYEISIKNFQYYPGEIIVELNKYLSESNVARGPSIYPTNPIGNFYSNEANVSEGKTYNKMYQPINVGGKTHKNKRRLYKTKKNKNNKNNKNKTKKNKNKKNKNKTRK